MPLTNNHKVLLIDMDDVLCDFVGSYEAARAGNPDMLFPQAEYGFFRKLPEVQGAVDAVHELSRQFNLYFLSAPSVHNPMSYTEKRVWIEEHLGFEFCERLILSCNKGLLKGDFLVDDRTNGHGQDNFEGELVEFGSARFPDWETVKKYLLSTS